MASDETKATAPLHETVSSSEQVIRAKKVQAMRARGIEPWPAYKPVSHTAHQAIEAFESGKEEGSYALAGRIRTIREHGKTIFAHMQDRSGSIQLYIKKNVVGDDLFEIFTSFVDTGDILWVNGELFRTKVGEITLKVSDFTMLSKCLHPLPDKFHGVSDTELRYRQRSLDLMCNQESRQRFVARSNIVAHIRNFLLKKEFLEVETPMLHPIPGGATARPFVTHHNAYDIDLYLRIAPELYLKRLVVGGFERVFEINRNFRNEGVSTRHNPEFTMLELYMAHADYVTGMDITEALLSSAISAATGQTVVTYKEHTLDFCAPFARFTVEESLVSIGGFTPEDISPEHIDRLLASHDLTMPAGQESHGEKLFFLFEEFVESKIVQPTFIMGHPIEVSPLSKADDADRSRAARFELFVAGMEIANSFSELNEPFEQAARFKQQVAQREKGADEAHHYDADYVRALEYGLPPTVGIGIGIDRLVMLATNTSSIKDMILFPTMKPAHHEQ